MFEWDEDEEVRDTIWDVLNESENHIVPYPKGSEDDPPLPFSEYSKKRRHEQTNANLSITDQRKSEARNDFRGSSIESNSNFHTNKELSAPRFDMDSWPDFSSLNSTFVKGYIERNHLHSMSSKFINTCPTSPSMETATGNMVTELYEADAVLQNSDPSLKDSCRISAPDITQLNGEPNIFVDEHEDKEGDSFLNCDWANIADFDDFDRIFRNDDSIFGHEMISNADEILSPSMDADSTTAPSFPMPDIPVSRDTNSEKEFSTFQVDEQSGIERNPLEKDKASDNSGAIERRTICQSQLNIENSGGHYHSSDKVDRQKKLSKARKKMEVKSRTKPPSSARNTGGIQQFENMTVQTCLKSPSQSQSDPSGCHGEGGGPGSIGFFPGTTQRLLPAFEYPIHAFPTVPVLSPANPERKESQPVTASQRAYPVSTKHTSNVQTKQLSMTPQEKIEKLRRRQQIQAMLAIQQQQQQFGEQSTSTEISVSLTSSQMNQSHGAAVACSEIIDDTMKWLSSSELNLPQEGDDPQKVPILIDDSLRETIFYQLQDAIGKLDVGVRLCIRDSLFRLGRSAMERHNTSDRSSANKSGRDEDEAPVNEETNSQDRSTRLPTETGTNPLDRIVAHLLFHSPSEAGARPVKNEMPPSPISSNPVSKQSIAYENTFENKPEKTDKLEAQTST